MCHHEFRWERVRLAGVAIPTFVDAERECSVEERNVSVRMVNVQRMNENIIDLQRVGMKKAIHCLDRDYFNLLCMKMRVI